MEYTELIPGDPVAEEPPPHVWIDLEGNQIDLRTVSARYRRNLLIHIEQRGKTDIPQYEFLMSKESKT